MKRIQPSEIHPDAWRPRDLHRIRVTTNATRERKSKVGEVSYQCRKGHHKLHCMKLNCPCPCHDAEQEAIRVSKSGAPEAGPQAAPSAASARQTRTAGASAAGAPPPTE